MGAVTGGKSREQQQQNQMGTQTGSQSGRQEQGLDANSQAFVDQMRQQGIGAQQMVQGHDGSFIAGPTDAFNQGLGHMGRIAGLDPNIQAQQVGAQQIGGGQFNVQAQNVQGPGQAGRMDFAPQQFDNARTSDFFNPFESQVVQGVQQDFDRQRALTQQGAAQEATAAGAFGGSRSAVLEAEGLRGVNQLEGQQLAQLRAGGFQSAQQAAMQDHSQMQNLGFGTAQANLGADLQRQQLAMQAQMANQSAGLQAAGMSQQGQLQAAMANQSAGLQAGMANQQAGLQAHGLNFQGLGLASQAAGQQMQGGELQRQVFQNQLQEPIMRAQLGQDFLQGGLGPTGMVSTTQQNFRDQMQQNMRSRGQSSNIGFSFG